MKKILILSLVWMICTIANAQTFHAIVFCNTIDRSIGQSMSVELSNVARNFGILEKLLEEDYLFNITLVDGNHCTAQNIQNLLKGMRIEPDDVVFTFYGGHGSHAPNNAEDPWPQLCMNTSDQSKWIPLALIDKWVAMKNPRLRIIMANCCNVVDDRVTIKPMWATDERATKLDGLDAETFRKLFRHKGNIMITSSKLGQYSWCNSYGGCFTNQFWESMNKLGKGQISPDWNSLMSSAGREISINTDRGIVKQTPYYKIDIAGISDDNSTIIHRENTLSTLLSMLVDKKQSQDKRLAMIPDIMSKYFNGRSKVITVASDMTTMIEYEDAIDFLHRICLSPYISGITILNDDMQNLKVHELR